MSAQVTGWRKLASRCLSVLLALVVALLAIGVGRAQELVKPEPVEYTDEAVADWLNASEKASDARWRERVFERFATELGQGRHAAVLQKLTEEFAATSWPSHNDLKARFTRQMERVVQAFRESITAAGLKDELQTVAQRSAVMAGLEARHVGTQSLHPQRIAFNGDPTSGMFVQVFFAGTPDQFATIEPAADDQYKLLLPLSLQRDLRLRADAFEAVGDDFIGIVADVQLRAIQRADRQWSNYLKEGYSQYPWESLFNGAVLKFDAFHPPDEQWILFHPTIGVAVDTASLDEIRADEVINIELAGYLRYYGDDHESFLGGSIAATLRDDEKPGLGVVAHWTKSFSLGVSWNDGDNEPAVFLSFDLFRYLQTEGTKFKGEYEKVRRLVGNL